MIFLTSLALAADLGKSPCLINLVKPVSCAGDAHCVEVVNTLDRGFVVPTVQGVCGIGKMAPVDVEGEMQGILDPMYSTEERPIFLPGLAPEASGHPSRGWLTLPKWGPMVDGVRQALNDFVVSARVFDGSFTTLYDFFIRPGRRVQVFDDDPRLDIDEHGFLGTCRAQTIQVGVNDRIVYGGSCSGPELAKSRR